MSDQRFTRSPHTGGVGSEETSDFIRRFNNVLRIGRVKEVNAKERWAIVTIGKNETDKIPWTAGRAGGDQTFHAYEKDEQVLIACLEGDIRRAVIIGALYQDDPGAPYEKIPDSGTKYKDKTLKQYDRDKHQDIVTIPEREGQHRKKVGENSFHQQSAERHRFRLGNFALDIELAGGAFTIRVKDRVTSDDAPGRVVRTLYP